MKLITAEIKKKLPLVSEITDANTSPIIVKFFGGGSYRLYVVAGDVYLKDKDEPVKLSEVTDYSQINDIHFYGYVTGLQCDEWGYTSCNELKNVKFQFGLGIERDMHWDMKYTVKDVLAKEVY